MLKLPNYSEQSIEVRILKSIQAHPQENYFIVTQFKRVGTSLPNNLHQFITEKIASKKSISTFKTSLVESDTRLILTFYPRKEPLNYKYALVHTFIEMCNSAAMCVKK